LTASLTRIPEGCGRVQISRFSGRLSVADAIDVMDGLPFHQAPAEKFLGHEDVLGHITLAGTRMIRYAHHHVARLVPGAAAPPVAVGP
jgi:hypothetical protein